MHAVRRSPALVCVLLVACASASRVHETDAELEARLIREATRPPPVVPVRPPALLSAHRPRPPRWPWMEPLVQVDPVATGNLVGFDPVTRHVAYEVPGVERFAIDIVDLADFSVARRTADGYELPRAHALAAPFEVPDWHTPDGRFRFWADNEAAYPTLQLLDTRTGARLRLRDSMSQPMFSPDGHWLAYVEERRGERFLMLRELARRRSHSVRRMRAFASELVWSGDSRHLYTMETHSTYKGCLLRIDIPSLRARRGPCGTATGQMANLLRSPSGRFGAIWLIPSEHGFMPMQSYHFIVIDLHTGRAIGRVGWPEANSRDWAILTDQMQLVLSSRHWDDASSREVQRIRIIDRRGTRARVLDLRPFEWLSEPFEGIHGTLLTHYTADGDTDLVRLRFDRRAPRRDVRRVLTRAR